MPIDSITTIIPNYNGINLISKYLYKVPGKIIIVDDGSTDNSVEFIKDNFPKVKLISLNKNFGFSKAANIGINAADTEFVVLLNNDVEVSSEYLLPLIPMFNDNKVFSVSPKIILPTKNNLDEGCKTGFWHHGLFYCDQRQNVSEVTPILYTTGCAAIYRKSMLDELGGFDTAYSPFYWEDADLGYRAWQRGWKSYYNPEISVIHQHASTISNFNKKYTDRVKFRNSLFFVWRNVEDQNILVAHKKLLFMVVFKKIITGDLAGFYGWMDAYKRRKEALNQRELIVKKRVLSDKQIFEQTGIK